jgi:hypothetical protein
MHAETSRATRLHATTDQVSRQDAELAKNATCDSIFPEGPRASLRASRLRVSFAAETSLATRLHATTDQVLTPRRRIREDHGVRFELLQRHQSFSAVFAASREPLTPCDPIAPRHPRFSAVFAASREPLTPRDPIVPRHPRFSAVFAASREPLTPRDPIVPRHPRSFALSAASRESLTRVIRSSRCLRASCGLRGFA